MIKYPIQYEITPDHVDAGTRWLTVDFKNVGSGDLTSLDVKLNSLDTWSISVQSTGSYIPTLGPSEERALHFQVAANSTGGLYISIDGWKDGELFHWESPSKVIIVDKEIVKLVSLFAMTKPYPLLGERIRCETTLQSLTDSSGLTLEFWAEKPDGDYEELAIVETKAMSAGEKARYAAEITPDQEGMHTIYAYLYDGAKRLGREVEHVFVREG